MLLTDPVICAGDLEGHTYERTAIEDHIAVCMDNKKPVTSPNTNTALEGNNTGIFSHLSSQFEQILLLSFE